jgi:DNA polymerase-3 subunit alpha
MWQFAEDLSADGTTVQADGQTYPVPCLVEDDNGIRLLVLGPDQDGIRVSTWVQAHSSGAALLVRVRADGYDVLTADQFLADRQERASEGVLVPVGWRPWPAGQLPTFASVVALPAAQKSTAAEPAGLTGRFVHLHLHTEFSELDGCQRIKAVVAAAVADGQPAAAATDHGNCCAHPDMQVECDKAGIRALHGMEAYFQPDRFRRAKSWTEVGEDGKEVRRSDADEAQWGYWHLTLLAMTPQGLRNLWAMSTEAYRDGMYSKAPRLDWDTLERLGDGVIATTGCLGGPICKPLSKGREEEARENLARLLEIFGDRLYVELGTIDIPEQRAANIKLVELAREFSVPLVVVADSHYTHREEAERHKSWLRMQPSVKEGSYLLEGHFEPFLTADEVAAAISYLGDDVVRESMANTVRVANRCTARVEGALKKPVFSKGENAVRRDGERLIEMCLANWQRKVVDRGRPEAECAARFEREMKLLISRELCGFYLVTADIVRWAKSQGILVGPCRGSSGASYVAWLADIIEVDPLEAGLPFERFLTEERVEMPDFDLDLPTSKREAIHRYVRERWGEDHVVRIGTHSRMRVLSAVEGARKVLAQTGVADVDWYLIEAFRKVVKSYAATLSGLPPEWDDVWRLYEQELAPIYAAAPELWDLAGWICGLLRTYGKHPAGLVISTDAPLTDLPMRSGEDEDDASRVMVTQFDYRQLDALGYLKYDFLFLETLDTLQQAMDLIDERYGYRVPIYDWHRQYEDPQVWDAICKGHTLGMFQIETPDGRRLCRQLKPRSVADLSAIMALGRPGPRESGLTKTYLRRRFGQEPVSYPDPRLAEVLGDTYGAVVYQEQVMGIAVVLAGYTLGEADGKIRKPLGKKLTEKMREAGVEFRRRAIEHGASPEAIDVLWAQLEEFARYSFGKAHSWGYAMVSFWCAWLKVHFPHEMMTAVLTHTDSDRIPEFVDEARRLAVPVLPPDVNESGIDFTPAGLGIRFGLASIKGIGDACAPAIVAGRPYTSYDDFISRAVAPKGSKINQGQVRALAAVGALDSLYSHRRALELRLAREASGEEIRCTYRDDETPNGLPCRFDWAGREKIEGVTAKFAGRGKNKHLVLLPPPKRCTIACRQYLPPPPLDPATIEPYTASELRDRELATLGAWLSSTPFDDFPADLLAVSDLPSVIDAADPGDEYAAVAVVSAVALLQTRDGKPYARISLRGVDGTMEAVCWSEMLNRVERHLTLHSLVVCALRKDERGLKLTGLVPVSGKMS